MEPRLLFIGAVVSGLGVAGLISYYAFHVSAEWGIAGLFFLSVGIALLAVYFITERKR
jgi:hypothetical protein